MVRTAARHSRPSVASLLLISASVIGVGCSGKVKMGETPGDGTRPTTFQNISNGKVTAIDLLLMIDNSAGMADKQATLATAVPQLLGQLMQPNCVDPLTGAYIGPSTLGPDGPCAQGTPEFNPVNNIHIGIVTSSLGDHGAKWICTPGSITNYTDVNGNAILQPPDVNDMGRLVGSLDRAAAARTDPQTAYAAINTLGFLEWGNKDLPTPGTSDLTAATKIFADMVSATKEVGCGYEAQLESWFRFLIDPVPPVLPLEPPDPRIHYTSRQGSDDTLLKQRAAFLRPDSLLAILMLTDENDCSIRDTDVGWVSATGNSILTGSSQCSSNPNDRCCYSCTSSTPVGCTDGCGNYPGTAVNDGVYQANLRCWQQKRRFGYEFLYPKSRYVVGLTKPELCPDQTFGDMDCDCEYANAVKASCSPGARRMPNPLYSTIVGTLDNGQALEGYPKALPRTDNSGVFLAGIVGVPWQDIATVDVFGALRYIPVTDPAWTGEPMTGYPLNPPGNGAVGIWDMIYGEDNANITPKDVHMVESVTPRNGLPGPSAAANADPFNGHEYNTALADLEYACIYPLPAPRKCDCDPTDVSYASCKYQHQNDCCDLSYKSDGAGGPGDDFNKPLCNGNTQIAAKAYPSLREIAVMKDYATSSHVAVQGNSVVASICPMDLGADPGNPGYGYNPAVSALVDRLKERLRGSCFPHPLTVKPDGSTGCVVAEAAPSSSLLGMSCREFCTSKERTLAGSAVVADVAAAMYNSRICDAGGVSCSEMCVCQLPEVAGEALGVCQNDPEGATTTALPPSFCYVDPDNGAGSNPNLVDGCPVTQRRILRFVGNNPGRGIAVPLNGSYTMLSCSANYQ